MAKHGVPGLIKGLGVTFKTMLKPAVTVQYTGPNGKEREELAPRARKLDRLGFRAAALGDAAGRTCTCRRLATVGSGSFCGRRS